MFKSLKPVARAPLLSQSVQDAIRAYILENDLKAGDPLPPETMLAKELAVSRNSVREAVKALESVGVLETRRGAGLFVKDFSFEPLLDNLPYGLLSDLQDLADLLEIRMVLETGLIEKVLRSVTTAQLEALQQVLEDMRLRAERGQSFPEEDQKFHRLLFMELNNTILLRLLDIFWLAFHKASQNIKIKDTDSLRTYRDHLAIFDAVVAKDVEAARTAIVDSHYAGISKRLQEAQQELSGKPSDT